MKRPAAHPENKRLGIWDAPMHASVLCTCLTHIVAVTQQVLHTRAFIGLRQLEVNHVREALSQSMIPRIHFTRVSRHVAIPALPITESPHPGFWTDCKQQEVHNIPMFLFCFDTVHIVCSYPLETPPKVHNV